MAKQNTNDQREFRLDSIRLNLNRAFHLTTVFSRAVFASEEETYAAFCAVMSEVCEAMEIFQELFPAKTKAA